MQHGSTQLYTYSHCHQMATTTQMALRTFKGQRKRCICHPTHVGHFQWLHMQNKTLLTPYDFLGCKKTSFCILLRIFCPQLHCSEWVPQSH